MALPGDTLTKTTQSVAFLTPDQIEKLPLLDHELGGVAIYDPSEGLDSYMWGCGYVAPEIRLARYPYTSCTTFLTRTGITEISFTFNQNMAPYFAYMIDDVAYLYWYDTVTQAYIETAYTGCISPKVVLDDKREGQNSINDILFFYIRDGQLCYRQQRDRFLTERVMGATPATFIRRIGMTRELRFAVELAPPRKEPLPISPSGCPEDIPEEEEVDYGCLGDGGSWGIYS